VTDQLTIAWEYLTGCCVSTDVASRQRAEWPPHPARVFMALAAAWFETDRDEAERAALQWLETLGDPILGFPRAECVFSRNVVDFYVPVNDKAEPAKALLQTVAGLTRDRQPRTFPTTWVGDAICCARWRVFGAVPQHFAALRSLCSKVTRIGHSSSLVRMWVADEAPSCDVSAECWEPTDAIGDLHLRRISPGFFELLKDLYGEDVRLQYEHLSAAIESLESERKRVSGKGGKAKKTEMDREISLIVAERDNIRLRSPLRPTIGLWCGYRRVEVPMPQVAHSHFDSDLLILTQHDGMRLPLEASLQVSQTLRRQVMAKCGVRPVPEWISGHSPDGKPSGRDDGHLALMPLPFVGHQHADGHLLGFALVFPRSVERRERARCLGPLLLDGQGGWKLIHLTLGRLGEWRLGKRDWSEPRIGLKPETWTANPDGATTWASVTPVVLDRFPKSDRLAERQAWREEVAGIVRQACVRIGLPEPVEIDLDTTSWHRGVPRAIEKRRRLRDGMPGGSTADAPVGDGFPAFSAKGSSAPRPQIHVWLRFGRPVVGPLLIGAGRYFGYGLFKPLECAEEGGRS